MNSAEIEATVISIVTSILKCSPEASLSRTTSPEWDSLNHAEIIFSLEEEFNIHFRREIISELDTVTALVSEIQSGLRAMEAS